MKKILITGGLGFIGTNLILTLLKKNYQIINLDKVSKQSNNKLLNLKNKKYIFKKIDLSKSSNNIKKIFFKYKPNYIINLASETHVDRSITSPEKILNNNTKLIINLLSALLCFVSKFKTKFIHIGTDEIYGDLPICSKNFFDENSKYNPNNPYSASKAFQNHIIKAYGNTYDLNYLILNPSNNFGPYQHSEKLIPRSLKLIKLGKPVEIYGDGKNIRNWIYVNETINVLLFFMKKNFNKETYNVASKIKLSNLILTKKIFNFIKVKENIVFVKDRLGHDKKYFSSNRKLISRGWHFKSQFNLFLKKTINWYLNDSNKKFF